MASKNGSRQNQFDFVSVYFTDDQKKQYEKWTASSSKSLADVIQEVVDNQVKLSISYDTHQDCYIVSVTFKATNSPMKKTVSMFRHADVEKCYRIAVYYVVEVLDYGNSAPGKESNWDW